MEPDDRTVDRDADPTRVRPDRRGAHRLPEDADAAITTVRPRFPADARAAELAAGDVATPPDTGVGAGIPSGAGTGAGTSTEALTGDATEPSAAGAANSFSADLDHGFDDQGDLDRWAGPAFPPPPAGESGDGRSDLRSAGDGAEVDELDGEPTTSVSGEPSHPSPRHPNWAPVPDWLVASAGGVRADPAGDPSGFAHDPDGGPTTVLTVAHDAERPSRRRDWAWVEEWRAERSAPAWGPGIALGAFVALIVAVALIVLTSGVSDSPVLAVVFNVIIAAGMTPALWMCRSLPVLRFLAAGAAAGILFGWIAMLTTF